MLIYTSLKDEAKAASPPHAASTHGTAAQHSLLLAITNVVDCCVLRCCHPSSWPTTTIIIVISTLHLLASFFAPLLSCVPPPPSPIVRCGHRRRHRLRLPPTSIVFCLIVVCCRGSGVHSAGDGCRLHRRLCRCRLSSRAAASDGRPPRCPSPHPLLLILRRGRPDLLLFGGVTDPPLKNHVHSSRPPPFSLSEKFIVMWAGRTESGRRRRRS